MFLHDYDIVIINTSGGKDSIVAIWDIVETAKRQNYPLDKIHLSHQCLGRMEWKGTKELVKKQAEFFGLQVHYSTRRDKNGHEGNLLEYVLNRGMWPSNMQRFCTSDYKRGPGARVVTALTKDLGKCKVLHVFGFRAQESPARKKKEVLKINKKLTTQTREVYDYLPVHDWDTLTVWGVIKENNIPYHFAYDLGMPRLSCVFCIFSPFDALLIAAYENPELLDEYIEVEEKIGHTFRDGFSLKEVREAMRAGVKPKGVKDWVM